MSAAFFLFLIIDLGLLISLMAMPVMRGEDSFFGVRVSSEVYRGAGRKILHRYWFWLIMTFVEIEFLAALVSIYRPEITVGRLTSILLLLPAGLIFYALFYREIKPFELIEERQRFASSLKTRRLHDHTSIPLEIIIAALAITPFLVLTYYYPEIPDRIPIHYNFRGDADGWTRKSFGMVFLLPMMTAYMYGLFLMMKHGLMEVKTTLPAEHTEEYFNFKEQSLIATMRLMDWIRATVTVMLSGLSLNLIFTTMANLAFMRSVTAITTTISSVTMLIVTGYYIVRLLRINQDLKDATGRVYVESSRDTARWYVGGIVYCNPDDPALFVEKRLGIGYTINFGNKRAYLYLAYLVALPLIAVFAFLSR